MIPMTLSAVCAENMRDLNSFMLDLRRRRRLFLLNLPIYFPFFGNHGFLTLISLMVVSSDDHTMISRPFMIFFFFFLI